MGEIENTTRNFDEQKIFSWCNFRDILSAGFLLYHQNIQFYLFFVSDSYFTCFTDATRKN